MRAPRWLVCCLTAALAGIAASESTAQPTFPVPPVTTIWHRLGIPQGFNRLNSSLVNRRGNFPGLERKPPLKRIADPANLESNNPAIKTAAEVKTQEDMAKQKIKAIKYLADLGCDDCYPGITDALIAALDDCTEKVRYEAAKAIRKSVENNCGTCSKACCCKEEMTKKLAEVAYELDDECCYKERSERVREEAAQALRTCCPNCGPQGLPIEEPLETVPAPPVEGPPVEGPPVEGPPVEGAPQSPTPAEETIPPTSPTAEMTLESEDGMVLMLQSPIGAEAVEISDEPHAAPALTMLPVEADDSTALAQGSAAPRRIAGPPRSMTPLVSYQLPSDETPQGQQNIAAQTPVLTLAPRVVEPAAHAHAAQQATPAPRHGARSNGRGQVVQVDLASQTVTFRFAEGFTPQVGSHAAVFHKYLLETAEVGQFTIVDARDGMATARPYGQFPLQKVAKGDAVTVR